MAATYWVNNSGSEYSVMDDSTMTIYSYNYVDDYSGNFYYYSYYLNDPYNQLGIFPGGNNYYNWTVTHSQVFDTYEFDNYQSQVRSRFVNAKDTYTGGFNGADYYFATAPENYIKEATNSKTFIGKGFAESYGNVSQGAQILPDSGVGRYYTIYYQAISGGQNPYAPDLQRVVDAQANSGTYANASRETQNVEQTRVVSFFQASPYGGGGGGGQVYELALAFGRKSYEEACFSRDLYKYFGDAPRLSEATVIAYDDKLRDYPGPGFYSDGEVSIYWDGNRFDTGSMNFCYF